MRYFKNFPATALSGSVVMTLALYVSECLPFYSLYPMIMKIAMVIILAIWAYGSFCLLQNFFFKGLTSKQSDRFELSAWIVSTALTGIMVGRIAPLWHGVILLTVIFAFVLWLKYVFLVVCALVNYFRNRFQEVVSPSLLLGAMGTASVAWLLYFVFDDKLPGIVYESFIVVACLLYVFILIMIMNNYFRRNIQILLTEWNAPNSLIFGAAALIGTVALITKCTHDSFIDAVWLWSAVICAVSTVLEIIFFFSYEKTFIYDVKHWMRAFSYVMFFVFTRYYYFDHYSDNIFVADIADYGLNVVTIFLIMQICYECLALRSMTHERPQ